MLKFVANISFLFKDLTIPERIHAATANGFHGVELLFPYDDPVPPIQQALSATGLPMVLINAPPPNYAGGTRGFAAIPGAEERFRYDLRRTLRYARSLHTRFVHVMAGAGSGDDARAAFVSNLRYAAAEAPDRTFTIEPINQDDMPGYFLSDFDLAAEILDEVGAHNVALQFDVYHAQKITGDAMAVWSRHGHRARHIQIAGLPDRHEPVAGVVDYPAFFRHLESIGYNGYVSAEYHPANGTEAGLGWMPRD
ncbi:hydroxypyruvate isomerase family protein [Pseudooceanicola nanhaiensis]|uniref:hydroxypyruvate isomerase family protein n=1 Tax=Pseudooceanicola nanhaiensis TaxID=375761 RepID=UPI003516C0DF